LGYGCSTLALVKLRVSAAAVDVSSAVSAFAIDLPYLVLAAVFCESLLTLVTAVGVSGFSEVAGWARTGFLAVFFPRAREMTFLSVPAARGLASEAGVATM